MTDFKRFGELVDKRDFDALFISELGWDNPTDNRPVRYVEEESGDVASASPIASKRGVVVYHCPQILDRATLEALDREIAKRSLERLLVLTEGAEQQWRWPEPRKSGGTRYVTHTHISGAPNPALIQRLAGVQFSIEEEDRLTVLTVRERVRAQFNADEVTSRFYEEFRNNQLQLMDEIDGIGPDEERSWYSSLLLNRLMFIYFMQRKEFLNDDQNYLRTSLKKVRELEGPNRFYDYYRDFLIPLFHEGLGSDEHQYEDERIKQIIGNVPYVNGGIFALHPLEQEYDIRVPDETFEQVFDFFDRYRWHLDERPTGNPEEINPEILGYIFEKYVNQKEQGAYYTREDVTGYMAAMSVLPVVLDQIAAATGQTPWHLLVADPVRYVPEGLLYGNQNAVPDDVASADMGDGGVLDSQADPNVGLPGERWRETLARRQYAEDLVRRLDAGDVSDSASAVTENLSLQTLALDWIAELGDDGHAAEVWNVLDDLKVVDPTCGSGAFLFAALDLLEELYDGALTAAEKQVVNEKANGRTQTLVAEAASHGSREYFLMKRTVLSNLYGVDLMPEATEIARLRLFLALVARLHDRAEVEPLPDLDMNIRAGNLLVGCATPEDAARRFEGDLFAAERLTAISEQATETAAVYRQFVVAQRERQSAAVINGLKSQFQTKTAALRDELNLLYSPHDQPGPDQDAWKESHRPFHWFVEFPEAMSNGGFDAVIGNPPYVAKRKIKSYAYSGFTTDTSPDIFAPCMERAASLVAPDGGYAMIVPISFQFSNDFNLARKAILDALSTCWTSTYSRNPAALFDAGLGVRSTIVISRKSEAERSVLTTPLRRWWSDARPYLFETNTYEPIPLPDRTSPWPRLGSPDELRLYESLMKRGHTLNHSVSRTGPALGFKTTALYYPVVYIDEPPAWDMDGNRTPQTSIGRMRFRNEHDRNVALMLLSGRVGNWWWGTIGDDFHVTASMLKDFPISVEDVEEIGAELSALATDLREEQQRHPLVTKYAGKEMGNYDMSRCRHITDQADRAVLEHLGLGDLWPTVLLADAMLAKATGERPGTRREWPFLL